MLSEAQWRCTTWTLKAIKFDDVLWGANARFFHNKNSLGNVIAIKQQFKHLYLQMSEWYCEGGIPSRLHDVDIDAELHKDNHCGIRANSP